MMQHAGTNDPIDGYIRQPRVFAIGLDKKGILGHASRRSVPAGVLD